VKLLLFFQARTDIIAEGQGTCINVANSNNHTSIVTLIETFDSKGKKTKATLIPKDLTSRNSSSTTNSDDVDLGALKYDAFAGLKMLEDMNQDCQDANRNASIRGCKISIFSTSNNESLY
jgi:hypothetical protein